MEQNCASVFYETDAQLFINVKLVVNSQRFSGMT